MIDSMTYDTIAMAEDETLKGFEFVADITKEITRPSTVNDFITGDND